MRGPGGEPAELGSGAFPGDQQEPGGGPGRPGSDLAEQEPTAPGGLPPVQFLLPEGGLGRVRLWKQRRARFWRSPNEETLLEPGEVYELDIKLFPTANLFKEGHRIRVDISSSNFPKFDVNPNTGEPLGRHRRMIEADNTIHHSSATHPSHIVLPLVPSGR